MKQEWSTHIEKIEIYRQSNSELLQTHNNPDHETVINITNDPKVLFRSGDPNGGYFASHEERACIIYWKTSIKNIIPTLSKRELFCFQLRAISGNIFDDETLNLIVTLSKNNKILPTEKNETLHWDLSKTGIMDE